MPWAAAAAVAGAYISSEGAKKAAKTSAGAQDRAAAEQARQYDQTREDQKPWMEAGESALGRYEEKLGDQQSYEDQIRSDIPDRFQYGGAVPDAFKGNTNIPQAFQSQTNVPGAYQSQTNIPQAFSQDSGNYFGNIQNQETGAFQFGREGFDQYKDPGYDFRMEEGLKALERRNAKTGNRNSGYSTRSLMELGQNLGSQEFGAARGRAFQDYQTQVSSEQDRYGRSVGDYGRRTGRESELYGRGRQQRQDETGRERDQYGRGQTTRQQNVYQEEAMYGRGRQQRLDETAVEQAGYGRGRQYNQDLASREQNRYGRAMTGYGLDVAREEAQYGRDLGRYGRQYTDNLNREAALSGVGQSTATELGRRGQDASQAIGGYIKGAGDVTAAGQLAETGAWSSAIGSMGSAYQQYKGGGNSMQYGETTPYQGSQQNQMLNEQWSY
jgi:hypothetical protein